MSLLFKEKLAQKKTLLGSWISIGHPSIAEIMADCEFDFLVLDMEHSVIELPDAQNLLQAIEAAGIFSMVRVNCNDPNLIKRVLDVGANGIIVPMIKSKEEAEQAVRAAKYPPKGERGVGLARAQKYGFGFDKYKTRYEKESVVIALIEHYQAIENLEEILNVDGLDGTLIGPYDLSGSIGFPGKFDRPDVKILIDRYEKICKKMKKPLGRHLVHPESKQVLELMKKGYSFLPVGLDALYLGLKCREVLKNIRGK